MTEELDLAQIMREWTEVFMQRSFRDYKRFMDGAGLSPSQMGALLHLYRCEACGVSDIGEQFGISVPAASQLVERLVQQGLLERMESSKDRRSKRVILTAQGKLLIEEGIAARQQWMERLTGAFTPEEQKTIAQALILLTRAAGQMESR